MRSKAETLTPSVQAELIVFTPAAFLNAWMSGRSEIHVHVLRSGERRTGASNKAQ